MNKFSLQLCSASLFAFSLCSQVIAASDVADDVPSDAVKMQADKVADTVNLAVGGEELPRWEFGLAAAAYNAVPGRVNRYLKGRSGLPFETLDYVAAVTGQPASYFKDRTAKVNDFAIRSGKSFMEGCTRFPILKTRFRGAVASRQPWGVHRESFGNV